MTRPRNRQQQFLASLSTGSLWGAIGSGAVWLGIFLHDGPGLLLQRDVVREAIYPAFAMLVIWAVAGVLSRVPQDE